MVAPLDGALKKLRMVNMKESVTYLFLSKGDITLCSLFSCYYYVFELESRLKTFVVCHISEKVFQPVHFYPSFCMMVSYSQPLSGAVKGCIQKIWRL